MGAEPFISAPVFFRRTVSALDTNNRRSCRNGGRGKAYRSNGHTGTQHSAGRAQELLVCLLHSGGVFLCMGNQSSEARIAVKRFEIGVLLHT